MIKQLLLSEGIKVGFYARLGTVTVSFDSEKPYWKNCQYQMVTSNVN